MNAVLCQELTKSCIAFQRFCRSGGMPCEGSGFVTEEGEESIQIDAEGSGIRALGGCCDSRLRPSN
jgi:hypothetical protein